MELLVLISVCGLVLASLVGFFGFVVASKNPRGILNDRIYRK
jgi:hypothetical protein